MTVLEWEVILSRPRESRFVSLGSQPNTNLDMFLQILRAFEAFAAQVAAVWFEWNMDPDVTCNVISLDSLGVTISPRAS